MNSPQFIRNTVLLRYLELPIVKKEFKSIPGKYEAGF